MIDPLQRERLRVILVRTRNPLNIGSVARVMSNLGFAKLRLVEPWDPSFREARSAVGAAELLRRAKVFPSVAEAVADCSLVVGTSAMRGREAEQPLLTLTGAASKIRARLHRSNVAILFGSEKTGLSSEELDHCNLLLKIQTSTEHPSLNLAQAVAITLYELSRDTTKEASQRREPAGAAALERLTETLFESLQASGYVKKNAEAVSEAKLRRRIRRLELDEPDAEVWLGMMKKVLWKLKKP